MPPVGDAARQQPGFGPAPDGAGRCLLWVIGSGGMDVPEGQEAPFGVDAGFVGCCLVACAPSRHGSNLFGRGARGLSSWTQAAQTRKSWARAGWNPS